jgi:hypothetical protein
VMFSQPTTEAYFKLRQLIRSPKPGELWQEFRREFLHAREAALRALYRDMRMPPTPLAPWVWEHAWQPLRVKVWERPRQYWCTSC